VNKDDFRSYRLLLTLRCVPSTLVQIRTAGYSARLPPTSERFASCSLRWLPDRCPSPLQYTLDARICPGLIAIPRTSWDRRVRSNVEASDWWESSEEPLACHTPRAPAWPISASFWRHSCFGRQSVGQGYGPTRIVRRATERATAALVWRSSGLRLRFAWHHKSLFDKYKPFCDNRLQTRV